MERLIRMKGILLVEDHPSFRQSIAYLSDWEPAFGVIAQAGSSAKGRANIAEKYIKSSS